MTCWGERTALNSCALSHWFPQLPITLLLGRSPVFMRCWPDCTALPSYPKSDFSVSGRISMLEAPVSHYWKFKLVVKLLGNLCLLSHAEEAQLTLNLVIEINDHIFKRPSPATGAWGSIKFSAVSIPEIHLLLDAFYQSNLHTPELYFLWHNV